MKEVIKKRKIIVEEIQDIPTGQKLGKILAGLKGITSVDVYREGRIMCEYDLTEINLEKIEKRIEKEGLKLSESMLSRLKRSFLYFTEQNEFDNLNVVPGKCCSSLPGEDNSCDTCAGK